MVAMVVSGSGSEGDHASLCSNMYAMKHCSSNIHDHVPIVYRVSYIVLWQWPWCAVLCDNVPL